MTFWRDPVGWWCSLGRPLAHLSRVQAIAAILAIVLALGWASYATPAFDKSVGMERVETRDPDRIGDIELYRRIAARVDEGEGYYQVALDEHRNNGYPTIPFFTVRFPTAAYMGNVLGDFGWKALAMALVIGATLAWTAALSGLTTMVERVGAIFIIAAGTASLFLPMSRLFHDLIAGLFLTLALGLYSPKRWWPSLIFAAAALAVRELALPFVLLWGAFALVQRRWREAAAVAALLAVFAIGFYFHAQEVALHRLPGDQPSPGWTEMTGPVLALAGLGSFSALILFPLAIAAPIGGIALLGWIGLGGRLGLFASLYFIGYAIMLSVFARSNNAYWILLVLPAYLGGLALVPRALLDLVRAAGAGKARRS